MKSTTTTTNGEGGNARPAETKNAPASQTPAAKAPAAEAAPKATPKSRKSQGTARQALPKSGIATAPRKRHLEPLTANFATDICIQTKWSEYDYERAARKLCFNIMTDEQHTIFQRVWKAEFLSLPGKPSGLSKLDCERAARRLCFQLMTCEQIEDWKRYWDAEFEPI